MELNKEQIKKALKQCANGDQACENCPYESLGVENNCFDVLKSDALALVTSQETAYNELYELCESCRLDNERLRAEKEGNWIYQEYSMGHYVGKCSLCGCEADMTKFCPNCGAKMR